MTIIPHNGKVEGKCSCNHPGEGCESCSGTIWMEIVYDSPEEEAHYKKEHERYEKFLDKLRHAANHDTP